MKIAAVMLANLAESSESQQGGTADFGLRSVGQENGSFSAE
jgi:hypothetical protein